MATAADPRVKKPRYNAFDLKNLIISKNLRTEDIRCFGKWGRDRFSYRVDSASSSFHQGWTTARVTCHSHHVKNSMPRSNSSTTGVE